MLRKIFFFFLSCVLLPPAVAFGQGVFIPPQTAFKVVNGYTTPIANATITVCAAAASGIPCSPALVGAVYKDQALTQPLSNPFTTDAQGNYQFAIAPGIYTVTATASGFVGTSYQITAGGGGTLGIPNPLNAQNVNVAGALSVAGPTNMNGAANFNTPGFISSGPGNWQGGFPAFGAPPDPFCAYMVQNNWWQLCGVTDPNNGTTVLAFNDGIGTPNVNNFPMMTDSIPSFQPQGIIPCWNQADGAFSFFVPCQLPKGNSGGTGQGALWSDTTHIYGDPAYLFAHTAQGTGSDVFVLSLGVTSASPNGSTGAIQFGTLGNAKPAVSIMPAGVTCPFGLCVGIPEVTGTFAVSASAPLVEDANGNLTCPTCTNTGPQFGYLTSPMAVQSSSTCTNVTNMSWNILANKNYLLSCEMPVLFVASAQIQWCIGGPTNLTSGTMSAWGTTTAVTAFVEEDVLNQVGYVGLKTNAFGAPGAVSRIYHIKAQIQNGSVASGTPLTLQTAANGTNNIQVLADTACSLTQVN